MAEPRRYPMPAPQLSQLSQESQRWRPGPGHRMVATVSTGFSRHVLAQKAADVEMPRLWEAQPSAQVCTHTNEYTNIGGPQMAQRVVSWLICNGRLRVHTINAIGQRKGCIIEVEDVDTGERVHGSPEGWSDWSTRSAGPVASWTRYQPGRLTRPRSARYLLLLHVRWISQRCKRAP